MRFSSENHNWDITIAASSHLVVIGRTTTKTSSFSAFTGSMMLAVVGLESFLNSVGYIISTTDFEFNFDKFEAKRITAKLELILQRFTIELDKSKRPYSTIDEAVTWRHSLAHSKPTYVEDTSIANTNEVHDLPVQHSSARYQYEPYEKHVNEGNADRFNRDVVQIINLIKNTSGIDPRAQCSYTN